MTSTQLSLHAAAVQRDRLGSLGVVQALRDGGPETKASALVMGFGNMAHKQLPKGLLFLAAEIAYILFMIRSGFHNLAMLPSLGSVPQEEIWNEELQVYLYTKGDQSILLLLYGVATILVTLVMFWIWRGTVKSAYKAEHPGLDAGMGLLCHLHQLLRRHDPGHCHQPQGYKGQGHRAASLLLCDDYDEYTIFQLSRI